MPLMQESWGYFHSSTRNPTVCIQGTLSGILVADVLVSGEVTLLLGRSQIFEEAVASVSLLHSSLEIT